MITKNKELLSVFINFFIFHGEKNRIFFHKFSGVKRQAQIHLFLTITNQRMNSEYEWNFILFSSNEKKTTIERRFGVIFQLIYQLVCICIYYEQLKSWNHYTIENWMKA